MEMIRKPRNGWIELWRFIFVLCVVSHHSIFLKDPGYIPAINGYISVEFFYILTGFFLFSSAVKKEAGDLDDNAFSEVWKRLKSIYPYFLVAWITSFVICRVTHGHNYTGAILKDFAHGVPQLLFLSMFDLPGGWLGYWDYIGTGWYLSSLIFAILLIYPLIRKCKYAFSTGIAPVLALTIYGYFWRTFNTFGVVNERVFSLNAGNLRAVAGLSMGSFCHCLVHMLPQRELSHRGKIWLSIAQIGVAGAAFGLMWVRSNLTTFLQILLFCLMIVLSFSGDTYLNSICSRPICMKLGRFSSIIFITQSLAYQQPWLPFPVPWKARYCMLFVYVFLLSLANDAVVHMLGALLKPKRLKCLWEPAKVKKA